MIFDGVWWRRTLWSWFKLYCKGRLTRFPLHCNACNRARMRRPECCIGWPLSVLSVPSIPSEWPCWIGWTLTLLGIWSWLLQPNGRWRPQPPSVSAKCIDGPGGNLLPLQKLSHQSGFFFYWGDLLMCEPLMMNQSILGFEFNTVSQPVQVRQSVSQCGR